MKPEITFYQIDESIVKSLAPLLLKVLDEKKKVLIFCKDHTQIKAIDNSLWSYGRNKFIPHTTIFDADFSFLRQPILISDQEENSNNADYLVFVDEPSDAFLSIFGRAFYFFESTDFATAVTLSQRLRPNNFYKKNDGKWVKGTI